MPGGAAKPSTEKHREKKKVTFDPLVAPFTQKPNRTPISSPESSSDEDNGGRNGGKTSDVDTDDKNGNEEQGKNADGKGDDDDDLESLDGKGNDDDPEVVDQNGNNHDSEIIDGKGNDTDESETHEEGSGDSNRHPEAIKESCGPGPQLQGQSSRSQTVKSTATKDFFKEAQAAIISYNILDLSNLPAVPKFGLYIARDIRSRTVKELAKEFAAESFTPFLNQCAFPLAMYKHEIHPDCVNLTQVGNGTEPLLELASGIRELQFCGGQHRREAVKRAKTVLTKDIERYDSQLDGGAENRSEADDNDEIQISKADIQNERNFAMKRLQELDNWGCIVYDRAKIEKNPALGIYISENVAEVKAVADPPEKLYTAVAILAGLPADGDVKGYLTQSLRKSPPGFANILHDSTIRNTLIRMKKFGSLFAMTTPMHPDWITKNLLGVHGGMLMGVIHYGLDCNDLLSSPQKISSLKEAGLYYKKLADSEFDSDTGIFTTRIWQAFSNPITSFDEAFLGTEFWKAIDSKNETTFMILTHVMFSDDNEEYREEMVNYVDDMMKEVRNAVAAKNPSTKEEGKALKSLEAKLRWYLTDHGKYHYAPLLPMMTPSTILCIAEVFTSIERAVREFCSWVCPMALHDALRAKAPTDSRSVSLVVMKSLKENRCKMIMQLSVPSALRTFAFFPLKHIGAFHQLEHDLAEFDSAKLMRSTKIDSAACSQMGLTRDEVEQKATRLFTWMNEHRRDSSPAWQTDVWPLNVEGAHLWRVGSLKNLPRDFQRNAQMALNEQRVAMKYRPELLKTSKAARWLRSAFQVAMEPWCASWRVGLDNKPTTFKGYHYPDMLEWDSVEGPPEVNLTEMKNTRVIITQEKKAINDFSRLISKLQRQQYLQAVPSVDVLGDDVRKAMDMLVEAGYRNIKRQIAMKHAGVAPKNIDPLDPTYDCGELTSVELTFYRRLDGWTEYQEKKNGKGNASGKADDNKKKGKEKAKASSAGANDKKGKRKEKAKASSAGVDDKRKGKEKTKAFSEGADDKKKGKEKAKASSDNTVKQNQKTKSTAVAQEPSSSSNDDNNKAFDSDTLGGVDHSSQRHDYDMAGDDRRNVVTPVERSSSSKLKRTTTEEPRSPESAPPNPKKQKKNGNNRKATAPKGDGP